MNQPLTQSRLVLGPIGTAVALLGASLAQAQVATLPAVTVSATADTYSVSNTSAATRTSTPIEQIPQSVVVIPRGIIEDQGSQTLSEALRNASNVTAIDQRDSNLTQFKIRGFSSATILDGVPMPGAFPNQQSLTGVEQVTVIKGPAGGLYGGSQGMNYPTQGGAIVITTAAPEQTSLRQVGLSLGNFGQKGLSFDLNQPISPMLAVRLTGEYSDKDSETERVYFKRSTFAPSLALTPNADTKIVLRLRDTKNETLDYPGLPRGVASLPDVNNGIARSRFIGADGLPPTTSDSQGVNLQWTQKLNEQWDFSLTLAKNQVDLMEVGAFNASVIDSFLTPFGFPAAFGTVVQDVYGYRMSQKFESTVVSPSLTGRFSTGAAQHTVTAGFDHEISKEDAFMRWSDPFGMGISPMTSGINLAGTAYAKWLEPTGNSMFDDAYVRNFKATTSYVQDQIKVGKWSILGSLRFSQLAIDNTALGITTSKTSNHTTPRVGAVYEFTPEMSAFWGYGEAVQTPYLTKFAPGVTPTAEESTQTEVGLRLKNMAGITATFALFDLKRSNVATAAGFANYLSDQGSQGIDIDLRYRVNDVWQILAAFTNQTAKYTGTSYAQVASFVGKQLFNVPNQQLRLAARYDAKSGAWKGWGMGLGLTYQSELPGDSTNSFFTPATTVWDTQVSYQTKNVRYGLAISNLLNKQYFVPSAYFGGGQLMPATPRALSVSAVFSF